MTFLRRNILIVSISFLMLSIVGITQSAAQSTSERPIIPNDPASNAICGDGLLDVTLGESDPITGDISFIFKENCIDDLYTLYNDKNRPQNSNIKFYSTDIIKWYTSPPYPCLLSIRPESNKDFVTSEHNCQTSKTLFFEGIRDLTEPYIKIASDDGENIPTFDAGEHVKVSIYDPGPSDSTHSTTTLNKLLLKKKVNGEFIYWMSNDNQITWDGLGKGLFQIWKSEPDAHLFTSPESAPICFSTRVIESSKKFISSGI